MTAQHTPATAELITAAAGERQSVVAVRDALLAKLDELVAYEDDLTVHRIAVQILAELPSATTVELGSDDYGYAAAHDITGIGEVDDDAYEKVLDAATEQLFMHASISRRAAHCKTGTVTGHGYTATWDEATETLTGSIDLAAAATVPARPALLDDPALDRLLRG